MKATRRPSADHTGDPFPRGYSAGISGLGSPPLASRIQRSPSRKNTRLLPSGDHEGLRSNFGPGSKRRGHAGDVARSSRKIFVPRDVRAKYARVLPSGDTRGSVSMIASLKVSRVAGPPVVGTR